MSDALKRAERCLDLAKECRRLAAISSSSHFRARYLRMAEHAAHWLRPRMLRTLACPVSYFASLKPMKTARSTFRFSIQGHLCLNVSRPFSKVTLWRLLRCRRECGWNLFGAISGTMKLSDQAGYVNEPEQMAFVRVSASHRPFA